MSFFKSPSPLDRLRRTSKSPTSPTFATASNDFRDLLVEPYDPVHPLQEENRKLKDKVGFLQTQLETVATTNAACGLGGPVFGRKAIRALEMDLCCKRQELDRVEEELELSKTKNAKANEMIDDLKKQALLDNAEIETLKSQAKAEKETFQATQEILRTEIEAKFEKHIANLQIELENQKKASSGFSSSSLAAIAELQAQVEEQEKNLRELHQLHGAATAENAALKKKNASLTAEFTEKVMALEAAVKAKDIELHKSSQSFLHTMRAPFQNLMSPHHGLVENIAPTVADKSETGFKSPPVMSPKNEKLFATTSEDLSTTDDNATKCKAVNFDSIDTQTAVAAQYQKHPLTPMPSSKKRGKTPLSLLKSAGGSIRRSARKTIKTDRFSPQKM